MNRRRALVNAISAATLLVSIGLLRTLPPQQTEITYWIVGLVAALFLVSEFVTVDVEFRHESQILTFVSIPVVLGLVFLPAPLVVAIRVATMLVAFVSQLQQPLYKLAFNVASDIRDVCIVAVVLDLTTQGAFGPKDWVFVLVALTIKDIVSILTTTAVISCFQGKWEPPSPNELVAEAGMGLIDVVIAIVLVTLVQRNEPAAILVLFIGFLFLVIARAYSRIAIRYKSLTALDRFTQELGRSVIDNTVMARLLTQSSDILHAERSWLIVSDGTKEMRYEVVNEAVIEAATDALDKLLFNRYQEGAWLLGAENDQSGLLTESGLNQVMSTALVSDDSGNRKVLVVADRSGDVRPFDDDDAALFDTLAVHAGLALRNLALVDRLKAEVDITEHLATHDPLTGLPNRILFRKRIEERLELDDHIAVLLMDLDRFKEVNDTLGHHNGDALLVQVADRLSHAVGSANLVSRLGGDEFAVLIENCRSEAEAIATAERLTAELQHPVEIEEVSIDVSGSVGVALASPLARDAETLLRHADIAMYLAKESYANIEVYKAELDQYSPQKLSMVGRLRTAIENGELGLRYQPQIDLKTGHVIGVEALAHWPQSTGKPVPPDEFIFVAEHTGLIHQLTDLVLDISINQAAAWYKSGMPLRMSVNLSAYNLVDQGLVDRVDAQLKASGLPPELFLVELTETAAMNNPKRSVEIMEALRDIGVAISIDDFGTGHSSLSYLTGIPATELKIDQSFVFSMGSDSVADTIVSTIVDLGQHLGLEIVAEGVETERHASDLREMGCEVAQGYYFSRPLELRGFELWIESQTVFRSDSATSER